MGKISLSNKQVLGALNAVTAISQVKASGKFKLKLARITAVLRPDAERIQTALQDLQRAHAKKDEKGAPLPVMVGGKAVEGTIDLLDREAYVAAERELLEGLVELELLELTEAELDGLDVEGSIEGILPLLK